MITPLRLNGVPRAPARSNALREAGAANAAYQRPAASAAGNSAPAQPMASLATLVAIQAVGERAGAQRRAARRGAAILDDLEALRLAVLEGRAGLAELDRMACRIESVREASGDRELESLVDAIELRAQVEIAKRGR